MKQFEEDDNEQDDGDDDGDDDRDEKTGALSNLPCSSPLDPPLSQRGTTTAMTTSILWGKPCKGEDLDSQFSPFTQWPPRALSTALLHQWTFL